MTGIYKFTVLDKIQTDVFVLVFNLINRNNYSPTQVIHVSKPIIQLEKPTYYGWFFIS